MGLLDWLPGGSGGLLDDLFEDPADTAKKNAKGAVKQSQDWYDNFLAQFVEPAKSAYDMNWDVALGYAEDLPGIIGQGYDRARLGIDRVGQQGRADILDMSENQTAAVGQGFASTGLYGSSTHAGALDGVTSSTARALGTLDAALAGQYGANEIGRATGVASATDSLARMRAARAGGILSFLQTQMGAANAAPVFADPGGLPPWAQFLSGVFSGSGGLPLPTGGG